MARIERMVLAAAFAASVTVTACSGNAGPTGQSILQGTETEAVAGTPELDIGVEEDSAGMGEEAVPAQTSAGPEEEAVLAQTSAGPEEDVSEAESGEEREIRIGLPSNEAWYSGAEYSVEGGTVKQVMFHDEITGSDAIVRACRTEDGDPSVFYYMFDDTKKESWPANTADGGKIDIKVEVTVENSDIHGVLATWEHDGVLYALWEDDGAGDVSSVAKLAVEIAERSQ